MIYQRLAKVFLICSEAEKSTPGRSKAAKQFTNAGDTACESTSDGAADFN
jgi:hypothetical protein